MNILIVEDEPRAAARLSDMLLILQPKSKIIATIPSIIEVVKHFNDREMPDLIIMDINLADGNCFSIFDIVTVTAPIIFCTAYDEFALRAFKTNGIAYLLKPVSKNDLEAALNKLDQLMGGNRNYRNMAVEKHKSRFLIQAGNKLFPVEVKYTDCFIKEEGGLKLYTNSGESYYLEYTVRELEQQLDPALFFRVNRQAIVAKKAIASTITSARNAKVNLPILNKEISISRERVKRFRKWYTNEQFLREVSMQ